MGPGGKSNGRTGDRWAPPKLSDELAEFERVVAEGYAPSLKTLLEAAKRGSLVWLSDALWQKIENCDSAQDLSVKEACRLAESYGRDIERILAGLLDPSCEMPAPIILELPDRRLYNVAGNTRLMACRALGIKPMVWWVVLV